MVSDESFVCSLKLWFEERAGSVSAKLSIEELCYVSGRDPRLWSDAALRQDMLESIREQLGVDPEHRLLEVGCAAGFLAMELSTICREYVGIDLSPMAVRVARTLGLPNVDFRIADATDLPFDDATFDRVVSYDVFTNFPTFDYARSVIEEMLRVVRPGGKVMIGSVPDESLKVEFQELVRSVQQELDVRCGPISEPTRRKGLLERFRSWRQKRSHNAEPAIVCYYFCKQDFANFGQTAGVKTEIHDIHRQNPYWGYRYNVVYTRAS